MKRGEILLPQGRRPLCALRYPPQGEGVQESPSPPPNGNGYGGDGENVGVRGKRTSGQAIPQNTWTDIIWQDEDYDTHGFRSGSDKLFTVPTGRGGRYAWITQAKMSTLPNDYSLRLAPVPATGIGASHTYVYGLKGNITAGILNRDAAETVYNRVYKSAPGSHDLEHDHSYMAFQKIDVEGKGAQCKLTADINNIPAGQWYFIPWDATNYDTDSMWDIGEATKLYLKRDGLHLIGWSTGNSFVGNAYIGLRKNGSTFPFIVDRRIGGNTDGFFLVNASAGDYLELCIYPGSIGLDISAAYTFLSAELIEPSLLETEGIYRCIVQPSAAQSIPTGTWTKLDFGTKIIDAGGFWSPGAPTKLILPADGIYLVGGYTRLSAITTKTCYQILRNGSAEGYGQATPSQSNWNPGDNVHVIGEFSKADEFEFNYLHYAGSSKDTQKDYTWFYAVKLDESG